MKQIQHFFIDADLSRERFSILDKDLLRQMKEVLRFRSGEQCVLLDNRGTRAEAELEVLHSKEAVFVIQKRTSCPAPERALRLYVALPKKPATLELIVQKATELGVTDIVPVDTQRCQVHELRKLDRLELIIKEAAEQCERGFLPTLHELVTLGEVLKNPPSGGLLAGDPWTFDERLSKIALGKKEDVNLVIGPEGGLSAEELEALRAAGATLFQLGDLVLRMETAAIAALSVVQFA